MFSKDFLIIVQPVNAVAPVSLAIIISPDDKAAVKNVPPEITV